jgi:hypothetical protein
MTDELSKTALAIQIEEVACITPEETMHVWRIRDGERVVVRGVASKRELAERDAEQAARRILGRGRR